MVGLLAIAPGGEASGPGPGLLGDAGLSCLRSASFSMVRCSSWFCRDWRSSCSLRAAFCWCNCCAVCCMVACNNTTLDTDRNEPPPLTAQDANWIFTKTIFYEDHKQFNIALVMRFTAFWQLDKANTFYNAEMSQLMAIKLHSYNTRFRPRFVQRTGNERNGITIVMYDRCKICEIITTEKASETTVQVPRGCSTSTPQEQIQT